MTGVLACFDSLIVEGKVVPYELIRRAHALLVGALRFIISSKLDSVEDTRICVTPLGAASWPSCNVDG